MPTLVADNCCLCTSTPPPDGESRTARAQRIFAGLEEFPVWARGTWHVGDGLFADVQACLVALWAKNGASAVIDGRSHYHYLTGTWHQDATFADSTSSDTPKPMASTSWDSTGHTDRDTGNPRDFSRSGEYSYSTGSGSGSYSWAIDDSGTVTTGGSDAFYASAQAPTFWVDGSHPGPCTITVSATAATWAYHEPSGNDDPDMIVNRTINLTNQYTAESCISDAVSMLAYINFGDTSQTYNIDGTVRAQNWGEQVTVMWSGLEDGVAKVITYSGSVSANRCGWLGWPLYIEAGKSLIGVSAASSLSVTEYILPHPSTVGPPSDNGADQTTGSTACYSSYATSGGIVISPGSVTYSYGIACLDTSNLC